MKTEEQEVFWCIFIIKDVVLVQIKKIVQTRLKQRSINRTDLVNTLFSISWDIID